MINKGVYQIYESLFLITFFSIYTYLVCFYSGLAQEHSHFGQFFFEFQYFQLFPINSVLHFGQQNFDENSTLISSIFDCNLSSDIDNVETIVPNKPMAPIINKRYSPGVYWNKPNMTRIVIPIRKAADFSLKYLFALILFFW